ncbi:HP0495 family protein [Myxococcus sp. Y35]|uniref:HP0495 family protein n=1 Tax=Pseudomyxococcus flavus TaxID=3115648 RepID=UPI003CFB67AB
MTKQDAGSPPDADGEKKPLIEYPTVYTFKVMGAQEAGFTEHVRELFKRLMGTEISPDSIREQPSSKGKYVSLSVSVYLLSEEHRRGIYDALHKDERVKYYL